VGALLRVGSIPALPAKCKSPHGREGTRGVPREPGDLALGGSVLMARNPGRMFGVTRPVPARHAPPGAHPVDLILRGAATCGMGNS